MVWAWTSECESAMRDKGALGTLSQRLRNEPWARARRGLEAWRCNSLLGGLRRDETAH